MHKELSSRQIKLPVPKLKRTIRTADYTLPVYSIFKGPRLEIEVGKPPITLQNDERITQKLMRKNKPVLRRKSPLAEALRYAEALNNPTILSQARVGAIFGVSRARVCQVLSLLNLDESIKKYLLSIEDPKEHNFFTERKLRQIALIKDKEAQRRKFGDLVGKMKDELTDETG